MPLTQVHSYQITPCFSLIKRAQMGWASVTESYDPLSSDNILCNPKTPHYINNKKKTQEGLGRVFSTINEVHHRSRAQLPTVSF